MKKILIAEDDFYILDVYKSAFDNAGYVVDIAEDGEKAVEKLKVNPYDVLLLDLMLPKVTGIEILKWCRTQQASSKNLLIFVFTNLEEGAFVKQVMDGGANGYFVKARNTPQTVVDRVNTALLSQQPPQ